MSKSAKETSFRVRQLRRWATAAATGRTLEIGVGGGPNLAHYPPEVSEVFCFDPNENSVAQIERNGRVRVTLARAEALPFPDESFDSAVATLVFCTVSDPLAGLREVWRVCKPGASLRLVEHVRSPNAPLGWLQEVATPTWSRIARGCHLDRNTAQEVARAGFLLVQVTPRLAGMVTGIEALKYA